ncbi:hypothetical protein BNJ_00134 [Kaumoebavirus]|uniref:hypothetical protein n=1 Tax=Kaumoebavirus TaxID=1859492 RepID=UPI0009C215DA|nr:hypothetical protein BNJ_00134 [Kaumoebavirus]ARA71966.1 hypothetical protein BNJ_00134 [Kaumoebavirus]
MNEDIISELLDSSWFELMRYRHAVQELRKANPYNVNDDIEYLGTLTQYFLYGPGSDAYNEAKEHFENLI